MKFRMVPTESELLLSTLVNKCKAKTITLSLVYYTLHLRHYE